MVLKTVLHIVCHIYGSIHNFVCIFQTFIRKWIFTCLLIRIHFHDIIIAATTATLTILHIQLFCLIFQSDHFGVFANLRLFTLCMFVLVLIWVFCYRLGYGNKWVREIEMEIERERKNEKHMHLNFVNISGEQNSLHCTAEKSPASYYLTRLFWFELHYFISVGFFNFPHRPKK